MGRDTLVDIVVPVSGGKDSQACLQLAKETGRHVIGMFCDTKFEHPLTYQHVKDMSDLYDVEIVTVNAGSVEEKILKYNRFPGGGARFCTEELKIIPGKKFYKQLAEEQGQGFEVWYGMRSDESPARTKRYKDRLDDELYAPHEFMSKYPKYLAKLGVMFKVPIIDWTVGDVMNYLDGKENPLYNKGFNRVGCFPCMAGGDAWKNKAFTFDEFGSSQKKKMKDLEPVINKSIWTSKHGHSKYDANEFETKGVQGTFLNEEDGSGCSFCSI